MPDHREDEPILKRVPLLPLRDIVIFPHMVVPLFVGREKSLGALGEATARGENQEIFLSAQRWPEIPEPAPEDIFQVGTLATLIQVLRLPDGTVKVLLGEVGYEPLWTENNWRDRAKGATKAKEIRVIRVRPAIDRVRRELDELTDPVEGPKRVPDAKERKARILGRQEYLRTLLLRKERIAGVVGAAFEVR